MYTSAFSSFFQADPTAMGRLFPSSSIKQGIATHLDSGKWDGGLSFTHETWRKICKIMIISHLPSGNLT